MAKKIRTRSTLTPSMTSDFSKESKLVYWKQILPKSQIHYTTKSGKRAVADFDENYLTDLATNKAVDSVPFLLADGKNSHDVGPENFRAAVTKMEVRDDGLYGRFEFPSKEMAKAVIYNPHLGVSARIREGIGKSDGSVLSRGIIHVLGTLDPQVSGMAPWQAATDLSVSDDEVLDLTNETFEEGSEMAKNKNSSENAKSLADYTEDDIEAMNEAELDEFLAEFAPDFDATMESDESEDSSDDESEDDDDENEDEAEASDSQKLVGAGAELSKTGTRDIELANSAAAAANSRATEALRRMAEAEWRETRNTYLAEGVPPHLLDLATPVLNRPDEMVIDLSNTDDDDVNVSEIVRGLLDAAKGTVDLSNEAGHTGSFKPGDGEDPDAELLAQWKI